MRLAFVADYDPADVASWSGIPHYMSRALADAGVDIKLIGPLDMPLAPMHLGVRIGARLMGRRYLPHREPSVLRSYATQIAPRVEDCDVVFSPGSIPLTKLKIPQPLVFWSDATAGLLVDFYAGFSGLTRRTARNLMAQECEAMQRAALIVFSSDWAAQSAIASGVPAGKIRVIPFGANLDHPPDTETAARFIASRRRDECRLLFVGNDWERKGGDFAIEVAQALTELGVRTRLRLIGAEPHRPVPACVDYLGFLRKSDAIQRARFDEALRSSHFFVLPTRAECTPIVVCEASAYGLPSLAPDIGGVSGVITVGRNGWLLPPEAPPRVYASLLSNAFADRQTYAAAALRAREEYDRRLNWPAACAQLLDALRPLVQPGRGAKSP